MDDRLESRRPLFLDDAVQIVRLLEVLDESYVAGFVLICDQAAYNHLGGLRI